MGLVVGYLSLLVCLLDTRRMQGSAKILKEASIITSPLVNIVCVSTKYQERSINIHPIYYVNIYCIYYISKIASCESTLGDQGDFEINKYSVQLERF